MKICNCFYSCSEIKQISARGRENFLRKFELAKVVGRSVATFVNLLRRDSELEGMDLNKGWHGNCEMQRGLNRISTVLTCQIAPYRSAIAVWFSFIFHCADVSFDRYRLKMRWQPYWAVKYGEPWL